MTVGAKKTVRISDKERFDLGLPKGVGITKDELQRAKFYQMMSRQIMLDMKADEAKARPAARMVGFDDRPPHYAIVRDDDSPDDAPVGHVRNVSSTLESMFHSNRPTIERFQYLAGHRARYDHSVAAGRSAILNWDRLGATVSGGKASSDLSDSRVDAMGRLGKLLTAIGSFDYWLIEQLAYVERGVEEVARMLGEDRKAIAFAFRMALTKAAKHYAYGEETPEDVKDATQKAAEAEAERYQHFAQVYEKQAQERESELLAGIGG